MVVTLLGMIQLQVADHFLCIFWYIHNISSTTVFRLNNNYPVLDEIKLSASFLLTEQLLFWLMSCVMVTGLEECYISQNMNFTINKFSMEMITVKYYLLQRNNIMCKVAKHSFCTRFRWWNSARAQGFQKQTCHQWSDHFIYSTPSLSVLFFSL